LYVGKGGGKKCGVKKKRKEKSRTGAIIMYCNQSHYIEHRGHFYGTEYEIWADFGPVNQGWQY